MEPQEALKPLELAGEMPFALPPATAAGLQSTSDIMQFALVLGLLKVWNKYSYHALC